MNMKRFTHFDRFITFAIFGVTLALTGCTRVPHQPVLSTPSSQYVRLSPNDIIWQYYAYTPGKVDYRFIAYTFYSKYGDERNPFIKHAMLPVIKGSIRQHLITTRAHPYVYIPKYRISLQSYSFKRHGFFLVQDTHNEMVSKNGNFILRVRAPHADFLPVKNLKLAKEIWRLNNNGDTLYIKKYFFVNGLTSHSKRLPQSGFGLIPSTSTGNRVYAICTKIKIYGKHNELLMVYNPPYEK